MQLELFINFEDKIPLKYFKLILSEVITKHLAFG